MIVIILSLLIMYNNQSQTKYFTPPSDGDNSTPIVTFMFNKKQQKNQRSQSSQIVQSILFNPNSTNQVLPHHKKIFTISYEDARRLNTQAKIRQKMDEYHEQVNKSQQKLRIAKQQKRKKRYRIKTIASLHESEKVSPVILKIMKQTLKHSTYNMQPQPQLQDYGLNIQQAKTYKILNKRQKLKIKYSLFEQDKKEESPEVFEAKANSPVRGGGFTIKKKRKTLQSMDEDNKQFLNNIFFKKGSLPKKTIFSHHSRTKKQVISLHDLKLAKMIACLDIILNSYHLSLQKQEPSAVLNNTCAIYHRQLGQKFTYYIGKGNNAELLRSIFKKRSWWIETNTPLKANLVWSQLKINKVIQNQQILTKQSSSKSALLEYEKDMKTQNSSNLLKTYSKILYEQADGSNAQVDEQAFLLLFHKQQSKLYYSPLKESEQKIRLKKITQPELYHNHFQFNYQIGNKNALYFNLKHYYEFTAQDLWQIVPFTYYLQADNEATFKEFQLKFIELQENNIWILKPGQNSNRGQRITLARSLEQVKVKLATESKLIVQSYIKNLLLYNGRKFDLRTYLLGVNMNGRLKFYFYDQGYIKTSSFLYSLKNINDKYVHLTNDAIQQNSDQYGKYQQGNKLSYMQFQRYLQNRYSKEGYNIFQLHKIMRSIAVQVIKSSYHKLNSNNKAFCFELFGLDFLIDSQFKPYLLEVNSNPCLQLCSHSLERLIPRMLQNLFRIGVDPLFRPQFINNTKSQSYYFYDESFLQKNQFRLIFDQKYDANSQWQKCNMPDQVLKECSFMEEEDNNE